MSGPPRRQNPPPAPRPQPAKGRGFDPSKPLLELDEPATARFDSGKQEAVDPLLPRLELPSRKGPGQRLGLEAVPMSDPLQDAKTLVSSPNPIIQADEPMRGGTQVVSMPVPTAVPTPSPRIPRQRRAEHSPLPFIIASAAAAMTWGMAGAAGVLHEPHVLPELAVAEDPSPPTRSVSATPTAAAMQAESGPTHADGSTPKGEPPPPPPAATWSVTADAAPSAIALAGATVVAAFEGRVVGYANGSATWTFEAPHEGVFTLGDDTVAVVLDAEIKLLSSEDGSEKATATLPSRGGKPVDVVASDANSEYVLVALADARFLHVTPAACGDAPAEDAGECVRVVGRLSGEFLEPSSKVVLGEDGARYLAEEDSMRGFDLDLRTVFEASTPADIRSMVHVPGNRLALQFGQEAVLLDPASCRGRSEVRLRTRDTQAPSGCVLWRYGKAIDPVPPAAVDTSSLALNERGKLQVVAEGDDTWKIPLGAFGPVAVGEGVLFTLATEGDAVVLVEIETGTGTVSAKHTLPIASAGDDRSDTKLVRRGNVVAATLGTTISVVSLPG